ncbi:MAG: F0F1 ATP synthase subunit A [Gemmatimonadaceae bacterium]|nr:F0F1 ATP synthase subunit A [Gemmatimonadaceae bacterium]
MMRRRLLLAATLMLGALFAPAAAAQDYAAPPAAATQDDAVQHATNVPERVDIITPHITDSHSLEYPCLAPGWACHLELPRWKPIHIGGLTLDLSPTKHVVFLWIAAALCLVVLIGGARAHGGSKPDKSPRGFSNGIEAVVLYLRNEVVMPNVGPHGDRYVPFVLTLFFFILFANLLGMIPYGATATGNISVTAVLALITFVMVEVAGMRTLGKKYIGTIVFWPHDMPLALKLPMTVIMTPVELFGKFTKPIALAIRLFANMTAGHVMVLALIGMIFTFGASFIGLAVFPFVMVVAIMLLELFVAFLQAFIFALLSAVFIGQIREAAH